MRSTVPSLRSSRAALASIHALPHLVYSGADVVELMGRTRLLVGQFGSGLANAVFCPPGSGVIELSGPKLSPGISAAVSTESETQRLAPVSMKHEGVEKSCCERVYSMIMSGIVGYNRCITVLTPNVHL